VIHAAGMTHPNECEQAQEQSSRVNITGTQTMLEALPPEVRFIYISTDLVFDGQKGGYSEKNATHPPNHYARTKQEAEKQVRRRAGAVVVRMAQLYGPI
jgi:dTDP-4-dehydrorhamnose reductase